MSDTNPYAPPQAAVRDIEPGHSLEAAPALWNPNAAASWSLLLTPMFGAFLHMKNWQAMGETQRAATSKKWIIGTVVVYLLIAVMGALAPDGKAADGIGRAVGFAVLLSWYFTSAKAQAKFVKERFGDAYPRRPWIKALLLGVAGIIAFIVTAMLVGAILGFLGFFAS